MRRFSLAIVALSMMASFTAMAVEPASRPNIILIMADDLGAECLGVYGSASYKTPRLDQMAAEGMQFTNAHAMPLCTPSRVAIMTGKYNSRNYTAFGALDPKQTTFGTMMKNAGYATGIVGKWQLDGGYKTAEGSHPDACGFDEYLMWHYTKRGDRYADPLFKLNGEDLKLHKGKYGPDLLNAFALEFIEKRKDGPFFLYYPMCLVHDPFQPTPDSDEWAEGDRHKKDLKHFGEMVAYMDKQVGELLDKLDTLGIAGNTLVLFTGDNGTDRDVTSKMSDGRVIRGGKGTTMDTGTHVPLIASWKGTVGPGTVNPNLVCFEDMLPTFAEMAGATLPEGPIDGKSFLAQLRGATSSHRDWIHVAYDPRHGESRNKARYARDVQWKLYDDGRLVNVLDDPEERKPIPAELEIEVRQRLQKVLDSEPDFPSIEAPSE